MKTVFQAASIISLLFGLYLTDARAAPTVALLGTMTYGGASGIPDPAQQPGFPGIEAIVELRLGARTRLELGAYYLTRVYNPSGSTPTVLILGGLAGVNYGLSRFFSLSAGGYSNQSITNPLLLNGGDFGAFLGMQGSLPLYKSLGFLLRAQYDFALNTLTYGSASTLTPREFLFSAGFRLGSFSSSSQ